MNYSGGGWDVTNRGFCHKLGILAPGWARKKRNPKDRLSRQSFCLCKPQKTWQEAELLSKHTHTKYEPHYKDTVVTKTNGQKRDANKLILGLYKLIRYYQIKTITVCDLRMILNYTLSSSIWGPATESTEQIPTYELTTPALVWYKLLLSDPENWSLSMTFNPFQGHLPPFEPSESCFQVPLLKT